MALNVFLKWVIERFIDDPSYYYRHLKFRWKRLNIFANDLSLDNHLLVLERVVKNEA